MSDFDKDMDDAMKASMDLASAVSKTSSRVNLRPVDNTPLTPKGIAQAVQEATDQDTDRATRLMYEQIQKIIEGFEREIKEANEVRDVAGKRIADLNTALSASRAALDVIKPK